MESQDAVLSAAEPFVKFWAQIRETKESLGLPIYDDEIFWQGNRGADLTIGDFRRLAEAAAAYGSEPHTP